MKTHHYEQLIVWKEAHQLCIDVYNLLPQFPQEERFGLCVQMRRSSSSVPTNIVEGNTKRSKKEKLRFLEIAEGSLDELGYQLILSKDLGFIQGKQYQYLYGVINKVGYLLARFRIGIMNKK